MTFRVKEEHIKLLRSAIIVWEDCEFGAPAIDCKRPYGNSDVFGDIARILGIEPEGEDDYESFTDEQRAYMLRLHCDLETVLQIVVFTGRMEVGLYEEVRYYEWEKVDEED